MVPWPGQTHDVSEHPCREHEPRKKNFPKYIPIITFLLFLAGLSAAVGPNAAVTPVIQTVEVTREVTRLVRLAKVTQEVTRIVEVPVTSRPPDPRHHHTPSPDPTITRTPSVTPTPDPPVVTCQNAPLSAFGPAELPLEIQGSCPKPIGWMSLGKNGDGNWLYVQGGQAAGTPAG